jgi:type IV pilus assembly protein PilC
MGSNVSGFYLLNTVLIYLSNNKSNKDDRNMIAEIKALLGTEFHFRGKAWSLKKKFGFYSDLGMLLSSGIDMKSAFEIIIENLKKREDKKLILSISDSVIAGESLSKSMQNSGKFSAYEYYTIKIGEETGQIYQVLFDLSEYFKRKIDQNRKIINAFSYPIVVIATAIGAVGFMIRFIVPMFEDIFTRFDRELPALTQFIIRVSNHFTEYFIILLLIILTIALASRIFKNNEQYKLIKSKFILSIPVFGSLIKTINLSRFCLAMSLLLGARTPLIEALQLMYKMTSYFPIQRTITKIEADILKGMALHESLGQFNIYDKRLVSLVKVAEQVNKLDEIFDKLKQQYDSEIDHRASIISSIMEPLIIVFIGLIVGLILISMYLPMFQLSTSFEF